MSSEREKEKSRLYNRAHKEEQKVYRKTYRERHRDELNRYKFDLRKKHRNLCIEHYSNGTFRCNNCGYGIYGALTIDHALNDGAKHRRETLKTAPIYSWLVSHNLPEGYQILCFNCNFLKFRHPDIYEQIGIQSEGDDVWRESIR
jgi:hypothetical protein